MDAETAAVIDSVGPRLRRVRQARGLTLGDVASRTGLSVSALSRVETGHRHPTLDVLLPLARVYEVSLDQLIAAPRTGDDRVHLVPHRLRSGGIAIPLTRFPSGVQAFKHVLGPREQELVSHEGHAWMYVLAGRLRLIVDAEEHMLDPGENIEFDASVPHWFGPADDLSVEVLHLFVPHGQRPAARTLGQRSSD